MKTQLILLILFLSIVSCKQVEENNKSNLVLLKDLREVKPVNIDSINILFDDLYRYYKNYNQKSNLEKNYPELISRIKVLKDSADIKIYDDLIRLIELHSIRKKYSDKETDSLNKKLINIIFNKDQIKEIRELYNSSFYIDSSKSTNSNMKSLVNRYNRINFYFRKQYYFRDSLMPKFWELCPLYYDLLTKIKTDILPREDSIKKELLNQKSDIIENYKFINSIIHSSNDTLTPSFLKTFSPIFEKINGRYGIYNMNTDYYGDKLIFDKSDIPKRIKNNNYPLFEYAQDSSIINYPDSIKIYAYSSKSRVEVEPTAFGYYPEECIGSYYIFPMKPLDKVEERLLFSSVYKIDLEFNSFAVIDSIINTQYSNICSDCPSGLSNQKTFAKLKGFDNIFFTVTANDKVDDTDTYIRAIYYVSKNDIINLYMNEYDAFGCSCL